MRTVNNHSLKPSTSFRDAVKSMKSVHVCNREHLHPLIGCGFTIRILPKRKLCTFPGIICDDFFIYVDSSSANRSALLWCDPARPVAEQPVQVLRIRWTRARHQIDRQSKDIQADQQRSSFIQAALISS